MTRTPFLALPLLCVSALLAACGPQEGRDAGLTGQAIELRPEASPAAARKVVAAAPSERGIVTAVTPLRSAPKATGAGAVIGGVIGAAVGNQVGGGTGRKVATVVGAVGGAKIGHEVEKDRSVEVTGYRIDITFDDGRKTSITRSQAGAFAVGQRVRMNDGEVVPA